MTAPRLRIRNDFPYPIACGYSLIFDEDRSADDRRKALCFTTYQLLRMVDLALVSQYLRGDIDERARDSIAALNRAIASIRAPYFSDWITLLHSLRRHLPRVGIAPFFPELDSALEALKQTEERPVALRDGRRNLDPLTAILALRNATAHGGIPDLDEAAAHVAAYLPVLHQILDAFAFLGDILLKVNVDPLELLVSGQAHIRALRGAQLPEPTLEELTPPLAAALADSSAVLLGPSGPPLPLYPLFNPLPAGEPLYLYDGHFATRVQTRQGTEERNYIFYLGTHHSATDAVSCSRLRALLDRRQISFFLEKEDTAPWTIANSAADWSQRTLAQLVGSKYFPECYLPFDELERHFDSFLRVPEARTWHRDTTQRRYVNGLLLTGRAGAGKTAFLARQVERLLGPTTMAAERDNPHLVLFLRGDGIALRSEGISLFRDLAEKLGLLVEGIAGRARSHGGFSSFRELLDHLHNRWKQDRVPGRCLVVVLDALNEAPFAEKVVREALDMVGEAACYPWCKVIVSLRQEWLTLWSAKLGLQEANPWQELRANLYIIDREGARADRPPQVVLEPLSPTQAGRMYERYREARAAARADGCRIPACRTPWTDLSARTCALLTNPLHVYLFMETFDDRPAEGVATLPALFQRYVERALRERPGLARAVEAVLDHWLETPARPGADLDDDDAQLIRQRWAAGLSAEEARLHLSPLEGLTHEGFITKRVREEGGGYRFVFQQVAEYLIYRHLKSRRPEGEDEQAYWTNRATADVVFAEYQWAFGFLLREWAGSGRLAQAGQLLEAAAPWLGPVLADFLLDQALTGYVPDQGSAAAENAVRALIEHGGARTATILIETAAQLMDYHFVRAAACYQEAGCALLENQLAAEPANATLAHALAVGLNDRGVLLRRQGRIAEGVSCYRRSVALLEPLHARQRKDLEIGRVLGTALNNLGAALPLLGGADVAREARAACHRAVKLCEALWRAHPQNRDLAQAYGAALLNETVVYLEMGQEDEALDAGRQTVKLYETLWRARPGDVAIGEHYSKSLFNLAEVGLRRQRRQEVDIAIGRSIAIAEALWNANPGNLRIGRWLAQALHMQAQLQRRMYQVHEAQATLRRSAEVRDFIWQVSPDDVDNALALVGDLEALGMRSEARQLEQTVLARAPDHPSVQALLRQREGPPPIVTPPPLPAPRAPGALARFGRRLGGALAALPGLSIRVAGRFFSPLVLLLWCALIGLSIGLGVDSPAWPWIKWSILLGIGAAWITSLLEPWHSWTPPEERWGERRFLDRYQALGRPPPLALRMLDGCCSVFRSLQDGSRLLFLVVWRLLQAVWVLLWLGLFGFLLFAGVLLLVEYWAIGLGVLAVLLLLIGLFIRHIGLASLVAAGQALLQRDDGRTGLWGWLSTPGRSVLHIGRVVWALLPAPGTLLKVVNVLIMGFFFLCLAIGLVMGLVENWRAILSYWPVLLAGLVLLLSWLASYFNVYDLSAVDDGEDPLLDDARAGPRPGVLVRLRSVIRRTVRHYLVAIAIVLPVGLKLLLGYVVGLMMIFIVFLVGYATYSCFTEGYWLGGVLLTITILFPLTVWCLAIAVLWLGMTFGWLPQVPAWIRGAIKTPWRAYRLFRFHRRLKQLQEAEGSDAPKSLDDGPQLPR